MTNHQGQIILPATVARELIFMSPIILYSLAYDAIDVMDDDTFVIALEDHIQIRVAPIGMVGKLTIGNSPTKARRLFKSQIREG